MISKNKGNNKISWIKIVLSIVGLIFLLFIIFISILAYKVGHKVSEYKKSGEYLTPTIVSDQSGVYRFEDLNNGYIKATSDKYKFSFEFPKELIAIPPSIWDKDNSNILKSISFQTKKRQDNDNSAGYIITVSPQVIPDGSNPCESLTRFPNWSPTTLNGLPAMQSGNTDKGAIVICQGDIKYSLDYSPGEYIPKNEGPFTAEDLVKEKAGYEHILKTFMIIN